MSPTALNYYTKIYQQQHQSNNTKYKATIGEQQENTQRKRVIDEKSLGQGARIVFKSFLVK